MSKKVDIWTMVSRSRDDVNRDNLPASRTSDNSLRRSRNDVGIARNTKVDAIVQRAKTFYFQQGAVHGLSRCIEMAYDEALRNGMIESQGMSRATIDRHVRRTSATEKWEHLFVNLKHKHDAQQFVPKLHRDNHAMVGFMDWIGMDGRQSDAYVYDSSLGRLIKPYGYYIIELKTGRIIGWELKSAAFTSYDVIRLLIRTVTQQGVPRIGIICDNGSEQIGKENIQAMEALWDWDYIQACRAGKVPELMTTFRNARSPIVTSLPRIPTFFVKGVVERTFRHIQTFDALVAPTNFIGVSRDTQVHMSLVRSPQRSITTLSMEEYRRLMAWYLTADQNDRSAGHLLPMSAEMRDKKYRSFTVETGLAPTLGNVWAHCMQTYEPMQIPAENYGRLYMHSGPHLRKRVTRHGQVSFQIDRVLRVYTCSTLPVTLINEMVDIVIDHDNPNYAYIAHRGEYIGTAIDMNAMLREGKMTNAQCAEHMGPLRAKYRKEISGLLGTHAKQHKPVVPETTQLPALTTAPLRISSASIDEALHQFSNNNRLDKQVEPTEETGYVTEAEELLAKYRSPSINN